MVLQQGSGTAYNPSAQEKEAGGLMSLRPAEL